MRAAFGNEYDHRQAPKQTIAIGSIFLDLVLRVAHAPQEATVQERIGKCQIAAPIDGTVLRVYARRGESFSTVTPRPLFSLADTSARHIKAEVDERDVDKLSVGQAVIVQADALEGRKLRGSVARISAMMGRKSISTGDPSDKSDRDILEATIDLDDNSRPLPIGLRVTVQFLSTRRQ